MFCPTRLGSASPATTFTVTGLFSGWEVPAAGVVPATVPSCGLLGTPTGWAFAATVSPALRSSAMACATLSPAGIGGTVIIRGPCETVSSIVAPGSARPDGDVLITSPFGTLSLITDGPVRTWNPAWCSVLAASAAVSLPTAGTEVYRPVVTYQPPPTSATRSTAPTSTYTSRLLNSHRCRNGSRSPPPRDAPRRRGRRRRRRAAARRRPSRPGQAPCRPRSRRPPPRTPGTRGPRPSCATRRRARKKWLLVTGIGWKKYFINHVGVNSIKPAFGVAKAIVVSIHWYSESL